MRTPSPQAVGPQGCSTSLGCVSSLCFVLQGLTKPSDSLWARSLPIALHNVEGKMLLGSSIDVHLPANSAPAAVNSLAGVASRGLMISMQLPLFVGAREHP